MATIQKSVPKQTVLIIDDEEGLRNLAALFLENCDLDVLLATNGRQGVEVFLAHAEQIDAVVFDVQMPQMCGTKRSGKFAELGQTYLWSRGVAATRQRSKSNSSVRLSPA